MSGLALYSYDSETKRLQFCEVCLSSRFFDNQYTMMMMMRIVEYLVSSQKYFVQ